MSTLESLKDKYFFVVDLEPCYDFAVAMAEKLHNDKKDAPNHRIFNNDYYLVGILGEITYSMILHEKFDSTLYIKSGDSGEDFKDTQIKATEERKLKKIPYLIEYRHKKTIAKNYVMSAVNLQKKHGFIVGWVWRFKFEKESKILDFGYGPRKTMHIDKLNPIWTYPPIVDRALEIVRRNYYRGDSNSWKAQGITP